MGSSILKEQMAYEPIFGHRNPIEETINNRWNQPVINPDLLIAIVRIQSFYRGCRIRNTIRLNQPKYIIETLLSIINSQNKSNIDNNHLMHKLSLSRIKRLSTGWMSCLNVLQQGHLQCEAGNQLIGNLILTNSKTTADNNNNSSSVQNKLYKDVNSYLSIKEYSGNYG
ncbi:unnamed protein product, partial [Schistosoma mattheei]